MPFEQTATNGWFEASAVASWTFFPICDSVAGEGRHALQNFLLMMAAVLAVTGIGVGQSISQENSDRTDLITETASGEFVVEGVEQIDLERALELYSQGAVFVDLRSVWRYDIAHIRGAVGLKLDTQFSEESLAKHAKKDQTIVFYCNHSACPHSAIASAMALDWGYTDVHNFADGWSAWSGNNHDQD